MAKIVKIYATDTNESAKPSSPVETKGRTAEVVIFPGGQPLGSIKPSPVKPNA